DWVFHVAALADIVPSIQNPASYHHSNVDGTLAVLESARKNKVQRFLYAASSSCYGIPDQYPTPESAPIRPQYPYALTKNMGEQMVMHWGQVYQLPVISVRFFNVYGPRSRTTGTYGAVFGVFLAQKLKGKPLTVVGDGAQTRDFTFVSDVVDACVTAIQSNAQNEIFNVGSGQPVSINTLTQLLGGEIIHLPKRPGEPDSTHADISKIFKILGWKPKVSFPEGVRILLDHIEDWREAPVWTKESIAEATKDWFLYLSKPGVKQVTL
ncbi:MAG: NAD-dependent epimerase/dehydratase family protein, partial [Elusimicrobia bacterium]|nr:NAD-dependent epimerase/dehydratase family protein [Elusimicrobiota bacterium]